jgi:hypothetical protein
LIGRRIPGKVVLATEILAWRDIMPINDLYHTLFRQIQELRPGQRITQARNFTWLLLGIYLSRSVYLSRIAAKMPGEAKLLSQVRRLNRLLDNRAIRVRAWYEPIARQWLEAQARQAIQIQLILDGTKIGFGHQLLMVGLAYRRRTIPIAWTWVKQARGHSSARIILALLAYVRKLLPKGVAVLLVGDCEFGSVAVLRQLEAWRWDYVLRQKAGTHVCLANETEWKDFGSHIDKAGQSFWLGASWLTESKIHFTNLLIHWKIGEKEPWCLATNLPDRQMALKAYARRMWIEEMFGDLKRHGFDLESTMLHNFVRLSRLTLAVALLYVWLISTGTQAIRNGLRHLVDRKDRRDLSIFQIGWRIIERWFVNASPIHVAWCVYR